MTNEDTTDFDEHFAKISSYIVDTLHGVPLEMTEDEKEQFRIQVISNQYAERLLSEAEKTETYACFKQCTADNEHGDEQDDVAVDEARKSGLDIQHAGNDQTDTDDHGRYAEGDLLKHEHDDREEKKE